MKLLLIGDRHNSNSVPENRTDDYISAVEKKDLEIRAIAKANNVKAILQSGDFWSDGDKKVNNSLISGILKRWYDIDADEDCLPSINIDIPIISIAGNHDLIGNSIRSLPETTAGLLNEIGYIKLATRKPIILEEDGIKVAITGNSYHANMDKTPDDYIIDRVNGVNCHVHITHGMLTPKSYGKLFNHTVIDKVISTGADISFCGHDHIGWPTVKLNDKYFVNPGAIIRSKNDKKEIQRTVHVVLVEISDKGITLQDIPLTTAMPGTDVLDRDVIDRKKEKENSIISIENEINKLGLTSRANIQSSIEDICTAENIDNNIRADISKRVGEKQVNLNPSTLAPKNTQIVQLELVNFQSHKKTVIEFTDGLNVIIGESRQGKSSIIRALRWIYENKPAGDRYIRRGEKSMSATVKLKNGTIVKRFITEGGKENGYRIIMPNGTVHNGNTKALELAQAALGFSSMKVTDKTILPLNFMRQGSSWFLIGEEYSAIERAQILGALQGTNAADAVVKDYELENNQIESKIKSNLQKTSESSDLISVAEQELIILNKLKSLVDDSEALNLIYEVIELSQQKAIQDKLVNELSTFNAKLAYELKYEVSALNSKIDVIKENLESHTINQDKKNETDILIAGLPQINSQEVKLAINTLTEISSHWEAFTKEVLKLKNIKELTPLELNISTAEVKTLMLIYDEVCTHSKTITENSKSLLRAAKFIEESNSEYENKRKTIDSINSDLEATKDLIKLFSQQSNLNQRVEDEALKYKKLIDEKINILTSEGICPTCNQELSKELMENVFSKIKEK